MKVKGGFIMSYHTFELKYQLTYQEKETLINALKRKGSVYHDDTDYTEPTVCDALSDWGIIIKFNTYTVQDFTFNIMYIKINPRRVMEQNNYIGIFDSRHTKKMLRRVDKHLQSVTPLMPSVHSCIINRIDFCSNIEMSSPEEVMNYLNLLKRGYCPQKYSLSTYYDQKSKRVKPYNNSITISNKHIAITYYNKYSQLNENPHCQNIDDAKNILRAEIQCKKNKVKHLAKKFNCKDVQRFLEYSDEIGKYVFKHYANLFYGTGDFYKLDEIFKKIDDSNFKKKSKTVMKELAAMSAKHSSLNKALKELRLYHDEVNSIMKKFNKIGISPVVIPRRSDYDTFKNPLTLLMDWYGCI